MTYTELLQQEEWHEKCNAILQRDKYTCRKCRGVGYHRDTIYIADTIEEADRVIDKKVFINCSFREFVEQIKDGHLECKKRNANEISTGLNDIQREVLISGKILWLPIQNVEVEQTKMMYGYYQYKFISVPLGAQISPIESLPPLRVYSKNAYESLSFRLVRGLFCTPADYGSRTCPFLIMEFEESLTDKYIIDFEKESINITFDKYSISTLISLSYFSPKGLNIHHKYYVEGKKPWEYPNDALVTLCEDCHQKIHEGSVPCYRSLDLKDVICHYHKCRRCDGRGYLPQYNHVQHGVCFKCGGEGVEI